MKVLLSVFWSSPEASYYLGSRDGGASCFTRWCYSLQPHRDRLIDGWLARLDAVVAGTLTAGHLGMANHYSVGIAGDLVLIEFEYADGDDAMVCLTVDQMKRALHCFRLFHTHDNTRKDVPPPSFEFEYAASGEVALERCMQHGGTSGFWRAETERGNARRKRLRNQQR